MENDVNVVFLELVGKLKTIYSTMLIKEEGIDGHTKQLKDKALNETKKMILVSFIDKLKIEKQECIDALNDLIGYANNYITEVGFDKFKQETLEAYNAFKNEINDYQQKKLSTILITSPDKENKTIMDLIEDVVEKTCLASEIKDEGKKQIINDTVKTYFLKKLIYKTDVSNILDNTYIRGSASMDTIVNHELQDVMKTMNMYSSKPDTKVKNTMCTDFTNPMYPLATIMDIIHGHYHLFNEFKITNSKYNECIDIEIKLEREPANNKYVIELLTGYHKDLSGTILSSTVELDNHEEIIVFKFILLNVDNHGSK